MTPPVQDETTDLSQKQSHTWCCEERESYSGGHRYKFIPNSQYHYKNISSWRRLMGEFSRLKKSFKIRNIIWPAVEPTNAQVKTFFGTTYQSKEEINGDISAKLQLLERLGYQQVTTQDYVVQLFLPDIDLLRSNLQKLDHPYSDLKIGNSQGIATDEEFIVSYFEYDGLLSHSREFLHDHYFHLIPLFFRVYQASISGNYAEEKSEQATVVKEAYKKIKAVEGSDSDKISKIEIQKVMKILALSIDFMNSKGKLKKLPTLESLDKYIAKLLNGQTIIYFRKHFNEPDITEAKLMLVWCKIMNFPYLDQRQESSDNSTAIIEVEDM